MSASSSRPVLPSFFAPLLDSHALHGSYAALMAREGRRHALDGTFRANEAQRRENEVCNRYGDILPYDSTRVHLPSQAYVNANWVAEPVSLLEGHTSSRRWLATQGPLPNTLYDFWSLALALPAREAPRRIVMLTGLTEGARTKCERYFPSTPSSSPLVLPSPSKGRPAIEVHLHRTVRPHASYKRNELHVRYADAEPIAIDHLECLSWHDHGVPEDPDDLLALLDAIGDGANEPPTLVHCSAGVGRTGTLIATSALLGALPALRRAARVSDPLLLRPPEISQPGLPPLRGIDLRDPVALVVDHLRAQRCMMVQTKEQQHYIYACLARAWEAEDASRRA